MIYYPQTIFLRACVKTVGFRLDLQKTNEYTEGRYIDGEDLVNSLTERLPSSSAVGTDVLLMRRIC